MPFGSMTIQELLVDALGGAGSFKGRSRLTATEMRECIKRGLPFRAFELLRERLGLSVTEAAELLQMPPRTLARRRKARRLAADESDRLYRLARVAAVAVTVFGDEQKAFAWLQRPNRSLDGMAPLRLLDSDVGARHVEDVLGRIEHGLIG